MSVQVDIDLHLCYPSPRARPIDDAAVKALASSISDGGLLNAITVRKVQKSRNGQMCDAYEVIAGMHRVKAFRRLQRETIPAVVLDVDDLRAELMLIDENLYRNDLSAVERAAAQARRKKIYLQLHPETAAGQAQAAGMNAALGRGGQDGHDVAAPRFDEAASEATGQSGRSVRRDVQRGEALGEDVLAKIARTSLDSGTEMDALIKLPEEARQSLIERAAEGEEVSAKAEVQSLVAAGIEAARPLESDQIVDATVMMPGGGLAIAHQRVEPVNSLDYFPTPPFATRALIEHVFRHLRRDGQCKFQKAWEPACGRGHMAEPLREYFKDVLATDIEDRGYQDCIADFLLCDHPQNSDWIITNPPFGTKTEEFILKALSLDVTGVAMFTRLQLLEGTGRFERIYRDRPPSQIAFFAERVPIHRGRWVFDGDTMTAYCWLLWIKGMPPQPPFWIPPGCRAALTRPDDAEKLGAVYEDEAPTAEAAE